MFLKRNKSLSKLLGLLTFFLLLILKGGFPKPASAQSSLQGLQQCTKDPACLNLIRNSSSPAVAAPIAKRNDEIGILVVPTGTFIPLYRWSQGTTTRAQITAKQKYFTTYPKDYVCTPFEGGQGPILYRIDFELYYPGYPGLYAPYYYRPTQLVYAPIGGAKHLTNTTLQGYGPRIERAESWHIWYGK